MPVRGDEVPQRNGPPVRPRGRQGRVFAMTCRPVLVGGVAGEPLEAGDGAERRLQTGPLVDGLGQRLVEADEVDHGEADGGAAAAAAARPERQGDEDHGDARHEQVQDDLEPALDAEHGVKGPLGGVEAPVVVGPEGGRPAEGADGRQAREGFGELRVERGLGLEVEQAQLARGAEVVLLDEVQGQEADGDGGGGGGCAGGDEAGFREGAEGDWGY